MEVRRRYGTDRDPPTIKSATETSFLEQYERARKRGSKPENIFGERESSFFRRRKALFIGGGTP